ncbi:MAG: tRNA (adenosine(37)-N6)-dimethylallyltransferase MiaA [bacterium]
MTTGTAHHQREDDRGRKPSVVFLFGPTATGKTALLKVLFGNDADGPAEIISADSMQVYRHMDIGTAKPTPEERAVLPHHLIDLKAPNEPYHVGEFVTRAERLVHEITARGALPIIAGGTAFYFNVFLHGLPGTPRASAETRAALQERLAQEGLPELRRELEARDPESAARIAVGDTYRILRALEVLYQSGKPRSAFPVPAEPRRDMRILTIGLHRERTELYARINARVGEMMAAGLPDEVRRLAAMGYAPPDPGMRAIGYREFFREPGSPSNRVAAPWTGGQGGEPWPPRAPLRDLDGELPAVTTEIQRNSRRYAKRQLTFFRKLPDVAWFEPEDVNTITQVIRDFRRVV